ncbi:hypothetical protein AB0L44_14680 [Nonomuraea wenchangensis]|uniref:hypothetical protein n=1 Tax=Nonomuraea wenchangensis TaxID=568860 RepID=UPI00343C4E26
MRPSQFPERDRADDGVLARSPVLQQRRQRLGLGRVDDLLIEAEQLAVVQKQLVT